MSDQIYALLLLFSIFDKILLSSRFLLISPITSFLLLHFCVRGEDDDDKGERGGRGGIEETEGKGRQ